MEVEVRSSALFVKIHDNVQSSDKRNAESLNITRRMWYHLRKKSVSYTNQCSGKIYDPDDSSQSDVISINDICFPISLENVWVNWWTNETLRWVISRKCKSVKVLFITKADNLWTKWGASERNRRQIEKEMKDEWKNQKHRRSHEFLQDFRQRLDKRFLTVTVILSESEILTWLSKSYFTLFWVS
jgi:hypothetical protein